MPICFTQPRWVYGYWHHKFPGHSKYLIDLIYRYSQGRSSLNGKNYFHKLKVKKKKKKPQFWCRYWNIPEEIRQWYCWWWSGPHLNIKTVFPRYGDSHVKDKMSRDRLIFNMGIIRRSRDRLIFNMGIPILVRWHLYNETLPCPFALQAINSHGRLGIINVALTIRNYHHVQFNVPMRPW